MNSLKNCSGAHQVSTGHGITLLKNSFLFSIVAVVLFSCGDARNQAFREERDKVATEVAAQTPGLASDTINGITYNFIRKADVKFKVQDVLKTTRQIESLVNEVGGYVTNSQLNSNKDYYTRIHFKKDSLLERTFYTATCDITLRVPNKQLDSVINKITDMGIFVDHRNVSATDVTLNLYSNQLTEKRLNNYAKRVQNKIDTKDAKLSQSTAAEENVLAKQTLADSKKIESYDLADQVNYSSVTLAIYQDQNIVNNILPTPAPVETYETPFVTKLGDSLSRGFEILKGFVLFLANIWSVILIIVALLLVTRKVINHYSKKSLAAAKQ
jgi:hypothetical protein